MLTSSAANVREKAAPAPGIERHTDASSSGDAPSSYTITGIGCQGDSWWSTSTMSYTPWRSVHPITQESDRSVWAPCAHLMLVCTTTTATSVPKAMKKSQSVIRLTNSLLSVKNDEAILPPNRVASMSVSTTKHTHQKREVLARAGNTSARKAKRLQRASGYGQHSKMGRGGQPAFPVIDDLTPCVIRSGA